MKILIISRGYPSKDYKTNGIFEFDQAKALVSYGNEVIFAALDMRSIRRKRKIGRESFVKDGVNIEAINIPISNVSKTIYNRIGKYFLKRLYSEIVSKYGKPDIIHTHFLGIGYITVNALNGLTDSPIVLTEHLSSMNKDELPSYLKKIGQATYQNVDKLITVSTLLSNSIQNNFGVDSLVIPNIVDTSTFTYDNLRNKEKTFTFVSTGGLIKRKKMDLLIEAINELKKNNLDVKLYIFGEGPERGLLEGKIKKYNLFNNVFLEGNKDRTIISKRMQSSHCFVLASELETFGVAFIEALASGLPVIATKSGGPEYFVHKNNGVLISVDSVEELVQSMKHMVKNASQYDHEKISAEMNKKFSPDAIANQLTNIYIKRL